MTKAGWRRSGKRPVSRAVRPVICTELRLQVQWRQRRKFNWRQRGALNGWLMRVSFAKALGDVAVRFLNRCTLAMLPRKRRQWGQALVAEQVRIVNTRERLCWAAGGITMTVKDFLNRLFTEPLVWAASIAAGILSAFVDLQSATRWPHVLLLASFGLILACWQ